MSVTPISTTGTKIRLRLDDGAGIALVVDAAFICYNMSFGGASTQTQPIQTYNDLVESLQTVSRNEGTLALDCFHSDRAGDAAIMAAMLRNVGRKIGVQVVFPNGTDLVPTPGVAAPPSWAFGPRLATTSNEFRFEAELGTAAPEAALGNLQREKFTMNIQSVVQRGIKGIIAMVTPIA